MATLTLGEIGKLLRCSVPPGSAESAITGINTLLEAGPTEVAFLATESYLPQFEKTQAAAVLVSKKVKLPASPHRPVLVVDNADLATAVVLEQFAPPVARPAAGVDPSARVDPSAVLGEDVSIGPLATVGARTQIGRGTRIHAGVIVGDDVIIGHDCELYPNVVVRERITIGHRVILQAGVVLGTDGFGYRWDGKQHVKIPQIGTVVIEDDVEIGSCTCIDRAKFSATRIGHGTKIDNLVQIGHNVVIGPHCIVVGQVGLAGSSRLGTGVVLGGQVAVRDHVTMGDGSSAAACSAIANDIDPNTVVSGVPALPHRQNLREQAALRRLPQLIEQMRKLQDQVAELEKRLGAESK